MSESNFLKKAHPHGWALFLFQSDLLHTMTLFFIAQRFAAANQSSKKARLGTITPSTSTKGASAFSANIASAFASASGIAFFSTKMFSKFIFFLFSFIASIGKSPKIKSFLCVKIRFFSLPFLLYLYYIISCPPNQYLDVKKITPPIYRGLKKRFFER